MVKKILLILLLIIVGVPAAGLGYLYVPTPKQAPPAAFKVLMTPKRIARGKYLFTQLADCDSCHSQRDFTHVAGPVVPSGRGRGNNMSLWIPALPGAVVASNITPDPETGIGNWTDGEKIRAIREGIGRDGRTLFPMMPYNLYRKMSDEDVEALVAYMNTIPPVKNSLPATQASFPANLFVKFAPKPA